MLAEFSWRLYALLSLTALSILGIWGNTTQGVLSRESGVGHVFVAVSAQTANADPLCFVREILVQPSAENLQRPIVAQPNECGDDVPADESAAESKAAEAAVPMAELQGAEPLATGTQPASVQAVPEQPEPTVAPLLPELQSMRERADCYGGITVQIVAHQDDDILFMNPDLAHDISSGRCVRTVFLTAGDAGVEAHYWQDRELGSRAAYAHMYGLPDVWREEQRLVAGHAFSVAYLDASPNVSLVFMRLPDGNLDGTGFAATQGESLQHLLDGTAPLIHTIDTGQSLDKAALLDVVSAILRTDMPEIVRTLGSDDVHDGDHSDHHAAGELVDLAQDKLPDLPQPLHFLGYPIRAQVPNISADETAEKLATFLAYGRYDGFVCQTADACAGDEGYGGYMSRQYWQSRQVFPDITPVSRTTF